MYIIIENINFKRYQLDFCLLHKKNRDQRDKTMADKLMYILNDDTKNIPSADFN